MTDMTNETAALLNGWRERFHPECPCPEEQQQPTQQPTPQGEQNDPPPPPRTGATDPPAGLPVQPLAQAGTKASKEELENKYNLTAVATKALPVDNARVVCGNVEIFSVRPRTTSARYGSTLKRIKSTRCKLELLLPERKW